MRHQLKIGFLGLACSMALGGCKNDNSSAPPSPPPTSSTTSFEGLSFSLVQKSTCDVTAPVDINAVDFSFNADQDTADPRDLTTVATACTS